MQSTEARQGPRIVRRDTRPVKIGNISVGNGFPIAIQSMCATRTQDIEETLKQIKLLKRHAADIVRIAIDSKRDVEALKIIRERLDAEELQVNLVVDLQENYRLIELVAPYVEKVRYNPGHLHHHEKSVPVREKVRFIAGQAAKHNCAIRIGINFGSLDPARLEGEHDARDAALASAYEHIMMLRDAAFENFVVSLKSSDPNDVIDINLQFAERHKDVPIHLGVTEAGMLPMGEIKTRIAFENLLAQGIGDTLRVSLTLPFAEKYREIEIGRRIVEDVYAGRYRSVPRFVQQGLNIISCPSCSRVENEAFIDLAQQVRELAAFAERENITIAVMGCRVNGPGETDDADLGLWCAPRHVNLKRRGELLGAFSYDEILPRLKVELEDLIAARALRR